MSEVFIYDGAESQADELVLGAQSLRRTLNEIRELYREDDRPWVVGFSGGKDSTAVLQLVYAALAALPAHERHKPVYAVSSDTQVETPAVVALLDRVILEINAGAVADGIPLSACKVMPDPAQTFWVNLLGKGYAAPTRMFRWCTERMKINPITAFTLDKVAEHGEVIVVLGARSAESASRAQVIARHRIEGTILARHTSLPNAYVYMPIQDWSTDDVWEYLMSAPRPWGGSNRALLELYRGSNGGECPVVIDKSTPSCGSSRFGCWVCTVVSKDRAMESLVAQGDEWMRPLLDFRNMLAETTDVTRKQEFRNERRRNGKITKLRGSDEDGGTARHVPGCYRMRYRHEWLEKLLEIQRDMKRGGHDVELIREDELHRIRKEWLNDPNEPDWSDALPDIYRRVFGTDLNWVVDDGTISSAESAEILAELSKEYGLPDMLVRKLLDLEREMDGLARRSGLTDRIHKILSEDWGEPAEALAKREVVRDGGYQDEVDRLRSEMAELDAS